MSKPIYLKVNKDKLNQILYSLCNIPIVKKLKEPTSHKKEGDMENYRNGAKKQERTGKGSRQFQ